jgi:post-segregation antitoxin (ccd killing protein)
MPTKALDRKRSVNVTLSADVVAQARLHTTNLSATIESLLAAFVAEQENLSSSNQLIADQCADAWHAAYAAMGTFTSKPKSL